MPSQIEKKQVLLGKSLSELTDWVQEQGQPAYRGKQLYQYLYQKGAHSWSEITVFPQKWRESLADYPLGRSTIDYRTIAPDKTRKYLLRLADDLLIETVGIPTSQRLTVCVSTQVGCAMGCTFCATGKQGFSRNLQPHEIVDQVLTVQSDFGERVSHVVFMGMGEPLANLDSVVEAVRILNEDVGISQRSMTISTVGLPGKIRELAEHKLQVTLAVSLHASHQQLREELIPTANRYPLGKLLEECREYVKMTGRRLSFEYIMLSGVNDLPEYAKELAQQLRGFQNHVNLIPYNPIDNSDYQRTSKNKIEQFSTILESYKIAVSVRYSRGLEAAAACGQLKTKRN
jgi:23S rRNA (adenine2503-C2)-methyltransferase